MSNQDLNRIDLSTQAPAADGKQGSQPPASSSTADTTAEVANRRKGEILANISHELRTPLQGIMGMAEALGGTELSLEQRTSVRLLRTSAGSLLDAVDDLLDYSLLETGQIELTSEKFDLEQLVADLFRVLDVAARERGLRLRYEIRQDVPVLLKGDARRLRQVLSNLVSNAIKFTSVGHVTMSVSIAARRIGGVTLHFVISDTGIGIPKSRQAAIFQPFVQLDGSTTRTHSGTGLGLRIANQLVELMQGEIWLESAEDQGSRFHFTAKFDLALPVKVRVEPLPNADPARKGTILLAEDNYINQMVTVRVLESRGYCVVVAANGLIVLDILRQQAVDLVLMDIQMPEMDGFEATKAIRDQEAATGAHVPIIALTAHAIQGYRQKCLDAGMDGYLSKPVSTKELLDLVARTLIAANKIAAKNPPEGSDNSATATEGR